MKILLVSSSSGSRGGGELYLLYLGKALAGRGHEVTLWASTHPRMDELAHAFTSFGRVHRAPYDNTYDQPGRSVSSWMNVGTARRIAAEWRASGADFLHINKQNLEDGLDLLHAAQHARLPSLCTIHLTQSARYLRAKLAGIRDFVSRQALSAYRGLLVTVLEDRQRDLAAFLADSRRVRLVPNGVPIFDLRARDTLRRAKRAELLISNGNLLVVAVGRMVPQKRPLLFLEYAERARRELPGARFLWIGDGELGAEWDREVAARCLGHTVQRIAWQSDVSAWLLAADVFLHVAEFEGLPLAVLEAMSARLPCAITPNLLREMPFLDPGNSIAIDDEGEWIRALADHSLLLARGAAARQLAEERFSFERMAEDYEALYREAIAQP